MFQSSQEMHEQIRLSCQRDALHQAINTEFERAKADSIRAKVFL